MIAQLVGSQGEVVGVDMTDEQLETALSHIDWHMRAFGHVRPNMKFLAGYIEKLSELGLEPESFDVIVSNCVINLSVDKPAVLRRAYELLKPGGELYFADVYCVIAKFPSIGLTKKEAPVWRPRLQIRSAGRGLRFCAESGNPPAETQVAPK